jgi:ubiquinone biosynthesis monooxygenase Coq7
VIAGVASASRPTPALHAADGEMSEAETAPQRRPDAREPCGRGLRPGAVQRAGALCPHRRHPQQFEHSSREEEDHLAWTAQRLGELNSHTSVLNPLFYAGAYALGTAAALLGDARSLGFVVETERQVEAHLESHLDKLPPQDAKSRAIVDQMRIDEIEHGAAAQKLGAVEAGAGAGGDVGDGQGDDQHRLLHLSRTPRVPGCRLKLPA